MATGIYADKRWTTLRARILRRDGYLCQQCLRYGKHRAATTVHHCYPAGMYPDLAWERWNLVSLCTQCHDAMHDRGSDLLTALGEQWRRRAGQRMPPPLKTDRISTGDRWGGTLSNRAEFSARGGSRGNKAIGRARGNLGGGFFGTRRFCAKKRNFHGQTAAGSVSKMDTKGA